MSFYSVYQPSEGFKTIEEEFEARLRKAFVEKGFDEVVIYSRNEIFRLEMMRFGEEKGWLDHELIEDDSQSSHLRVFLTEAGKKHFGLA